MSKLTAGGAHEPLLEISAHKPDATGQTSDIMEVEGITSDVSEPENLASVIQGANPIFLASAVRTRANSELNQ